MQAEAEAVFAVLAGWKYCSTCHTPVKQWQFDTRHPTCYLAFIIDSYPYLLKAGSLSELMDCALKAILDD